MIYTVPDYYREFHCIADKCEDTCCAGWQIVIDEKTLERYRKMRGPFFKKLLTGVNWINGTFKQDKEGRCAFLNENNLCRLYRTHGEKGFCKTCRNYPRHIEEFEGVREISLSVSCPEAARILMEKKEPVRFLTYERQGEEEFEDFDPFLFSVLEDARTVMIKLLQNRSLALSERIVLVYGMAHDMQGRINRQELFDCEAVIEKYNSEKGYEFAKAYVETEVRKKNSLALVPELFSCLYELEHLREDWPELLRETDAILYQNGKEHYKKVNTEFSQWKQENEVEIHLEQLLVYFIFTYFTGAVYDGEVFSKVQTSIFCVLMIEELWKARWKRNGELDRAEMTELLHRFSREVEHSDENLEKLDRIMRKKW